MQRAPRASIKPRKIKGRWNGSWDRNGVFSPHVVQDPDEYLLAAAEQPVVYYPTGGFSNPEAAGYGNSDEWPFDYQHACRHDGYRAGVYNALQSRWTAPNFKYYAQKLLDRVWATRRQAAQAANKYHTSFQEELDVVLQFNPYQTTFYRTPVHARGRHQW